MTTERKTRVLLLFGGRSSEHDVSVQSAVFIKTNLSPARYEVIPAGISRKGDWLLVAGDFDSETVDLDQGQRVAVIPGPGARGLWVQKDRVFRFLECVDVVFPVLHGPFGEDGTIQGLLELAGVPYVGAGVMASAVGMDKAMMKSVFARAGLPQVRYVMVLRRDWESTPNAVRDRIESELGYPCFVKPANLGSSVGISKVKDPGGLAAAMDTACRYDRKLVVEQALAGVREIECAVLGNDDPETSIPGEIRPGREFYDYTAKYLDDTSELVIPAPLEASLQRRVREAAAEAFKAIDCAGMARVDLFVDESTDHIYVNEINTIPGFTRISMYPKLWEASGLPPEKLVDRLIELAIERYRDRQRNVF